MREIDVKELFDLAMDEVVALEEGLYSLAKLLREKNELRVFFENPAIKDKDKKKMFVDLFPAASPIFKKVINLLIDEGLEKSLLGLSEDLTQMVSERLDLTFADVTTPYPLSDEERARIGKFVGQKPHLRITVDPALIGGVKIVTSDCRLFDGSIKGAIDRLKEDLIYAGK